MKENREANYDMLRIVSAVAIIMIHVSGKYITAVTDENIFGDYYVQNIAFNSFCNVISRFAVPCFVMLSGAFILDDKRNIDYAFFYKRTVRKIGIPMMIFSLFYVLYREIFVLREVFMYGKEAKLFLEPVYQWIIGAPFYHMWYLYMMLGVYLHVPLVIRLKMDIGEKKFERVTWIFLVAACLSVWTSKYQLNWNLGQSFCYLAYFMVGYVIRRRTIENKNNVKGVMLILGGILIESVVSFLRYQQAILGIGDGELKYELVTSFNPLILSASILIFVGFSFLNLRVKLSKLSALTFYIYLFHAGVWDVGFKIVNKIAGIEANSIIIIPVCVVIVFIVSLVLSIIYMRIWSLLEKKFYIADKGCRLLKIL